MIQARKFGKYEGRDVIEATLRSDIAKVSILNYGCVVRDWQVRGLNESITVVLGFERFEHYQLYSPSFGIIAGRVANRTARGRFDLNGTKYQLPINNGVNHLHGGIAGLGRRIWELETDTASNSIKLTYHSKNGEEGYPAAVDFTVIYRLKGARLTCEMKGEPSAPTPINLAQHSYYNLNGAGDVRDHQIQIAARTYTPVDATQIPTGEILPVEDSRFDFTQLTTFDATDPDQIGVDHNLVLDAARDLDQPTATVFSPQSNLELKLWTREPGLQLFNAPDMDIPVAGLNAENYGPFSGVCLEAQHFPDSLNRPEWPSIICTPDDPYTQKLDVEIAER
jgi:aldose 1-epimerase